MDPRIFLACLAVVAADAVAGGGIYKCVDAGSTSYQSTPCARGQDATPMSIASLAAEAPRRGMTTSAATSAQPRKRGPWTRADDEIGISDDEVLNMPNWGRPAQISRTRGPRGWEEVWRYGNGYGGGRELRFVNARLADIVETPAVIASARPAP
jgi:hypothetical protein